MAARDKLLASTVSFAHLHGIAKPLGAKADEDKDDDKKDMKQGADESDDDYAKRMEDDKDGDGDKKDDTDDDKMEGDDLDEEDDKKDEKTKAAHARGVKAERARWASVLGHKSFAGNPALGARLLATTTMSGKAIVACLRESPAAVAPSNSNRAASNPDIGPSGGKSPGAATTNDRWAAAYKRAGVVK